MPVPVLTGEARLWEPRRLRLRLLSTAAQCVTTGRRRYSRLVRRWLWAGVITDVLGRFHAIPELRLTSTVAPLQAAPPRPGLWDLAHA